MKRITLTDDEFALIVAALDTTARTVGLRGARDIVRLQDALDRADTLPDDAPIGTPAVDV